MSRVGAGKGRGKVVGAVQNHLVGLELEKSVPFFPMLAELEMPFPDVLTEVHLLVEVAQIISFALLPYHNWGFVLNGILRALHFSHIPLYDSDILGLSYLGVLVVCCVALGLCLYAGVVILAHLVRTSDEVTGSFFGINSFRTMRLIMYLFGSILYVPLLQNFLSIGFCNQATRQLFWFPEQECVAGIGTFTLAICIVGVVLTFFVAYVMNQLVYDSSPMSRHYFGRAHSILDAPFLAFQLISVALMHYFHATGINMVYHSVWMACSSLCMAVAFIYFPPYFRKVTTQIRVTALLLCTTFSVFAACSHAAQVRNQFFSNDHSDVAIVLATFPVFAFFFWKYVALARTSTIFTRAMEMLHEGIVMNDIVHFPRNLPEEELLFDNNTELLTELMEGAAPVEGEEGNENTEYHFTYPYVDYINHEYDVELANRFAVFYRKFTLQELTKYQLGYAASVYMKGVQKFRLSSFVRLCFATFLMNHAGKPRLALQQINAFRSMEANLADRYQGYKVFARLSSLLHLGQSSRMEALSRAKRRHREALHHTMEFWQLLLNEDVDKNALSNSTRAILSGKEDVLRIYKILLTKNPNNLDILACYTTFCETLLNNNEATQQCLQCLREGRELKTANTMRGAKVKGDTGTMTQIPLEFEENEDGTEQTDGIRQVSVLLFFVTLFLLLLVGGFLAMFIVTQAEGAKQIEAVVGAGQLRGLASQCAVAAYELTTNSRMGGNITKNAFQLLALQKDFLSWHNALTLGTYQVHTAPQVDFYRDLKAGSLDPDFSINLWTLGSLVSVALRDVVAHPNTSDYLGWVLYDLPNTVSATLNHSVTLWEDAYQSNQETQQLWTGVLLGLSLVTVSLGCLLVYFNIHKIEGVRADIFSLFTLIPRKVLRRLFRESRKRYTELDLFFSLSTKKKLVKLIGAEQDDQQALQLNLNEVEENRKMSGSESEIQSKRNGSICSSVAGGKDDDEGTVKRRSKKSAKDDIAHHKAEIEADKQSLELQFGSDSVFTKPSALLFAALLLGGVTLIVLISYSSTFPTKNSAVFRDQVGMYQIIETMNDVTRELLESSRGFVFTGQQRYFERYIMAHGQVPWGDLTKAILFASPATGFFTKLFALQDLHAALQQQLDIAMRLATTSYPTTAKMQLTGVETTFLSRLSWGGEETLLTTKVASLWTATTPRLGLLKGSTIDLAATAATQLTAAQTITTWAFIQELQDVLARELRSLNEIDSLETNRHLIHDNVYAMMLTSVIVAFVTLALTAGLWLLRRSSSELNDYQNTMIIVMLMAAVAAAFALALTGFVFTAREDTINPFPRFLRDVKGTRTAWNDAINQELDYPRLFLSGGNQLWNLRYRDVFFTDFSPSVVNPLGDVAIVVASDRSNQLSQSPDNVRDVTDLIASVNLIKQLDQIAMVLIHSATSTATPVNQVASAVVNSTYLSRISWNFTSEPDYHVTYARYHIIDNEMFYTNRGDDLLLSSASMLSLGTATLYSNRADDAIQNIRTKLLSIFNRLDANALTIQQSNTDLTTAILQASFACACVYLVSLLFLGLNIFFAFSRSGASLKAKDASQSSASVSAASGNSATLTETSLPFFGYAFLVLLIFGIAGASIAQVETQAAVAERLNDATARLWIGPRAMLVAQRMASDVTYFVESQEEIKRMYHQTLESVTSLYFRGRSTYFAVGKDTTQDDLSFNKQPWYSFLTFFAASSATASSSSSTASLTENIASSSATNAPATTANIVSANNPYQCNVSQGSAYLLSISRGVSLVYDSQWTSILQRLSYAAPTDVASIVAEMRALYDPMVLGLTLSVNRYQAYESNVASQWKTAIMIITIITLVVALLMHFAVLNRFTTFLAAEESSARLMLRIIPQDARDSNKQIASFLESGRVKQSADDLNSAIASMSTLPVIAIDQKGIVMRFTQAAENVFGYTSSEVVGLNVNHLMPEDIARNHDTFLANYRRTRVKHVIDSTRRVKGKRKNGEYFPLDLKVMEMRFGEESVFVGFARDISGELDLQVQDQLNKYVLDMSRDPIITIDAFGQVVNVNQAVTAVFGYNKDELVRENIKMLMPSEIALNHDGYLARYRETNVKHIIDSTRQVQGQRKNGEIFQASVTVREIRQHGEQPLFIGFVVDVTEEHEAAMLNEVNDIISDLSPVPIIAINDKGVFVKFSRAASQLFQYTKEELVGRGQNIQMLVPPKFGDHSRFMKAYFTTGVAKVVGMTRNIIARKRDKTIFPAMLTLREIRKESMQPVFLGYLVDITQSLQLEEAGRLASEIMRFSMIPIIVTSLTGIITGMNQAAEQTFQFLSEEVTGKNVKMLIPPSIAPVHDNIISNYLKTREKNVVGLNRVVQACRKNGELFPVDLSLREVPESESGEGCFFAYMRDVTSHRETLQQFMINESITQLSTVPIIAISNKGLIESFSPAAEDCFGYSTSEVIGENIKMLMPTEIADKHDEYLRRYRKTGIKTIIDSTRVIPARKRDGTIFQMEVSVREIKKEGTQSSFVGYCRDTSRDTQLEEERQLGGTIRDLSVIPIVLTNDHGDITYVNSAFCNEFQYSSREAVGQNLKILMIEEIAVKHDAYLKTYRERGIRASDNSTIVNKTRRLTAIRRDGSSVEVEAKVAEIRSERSGTLQFVGFVRNLGTQLQLEQANQTIDTITNLSLIPIVAIDHRGIVIKFSQAAEHSFGYKPTEVLGNNVKMLMPEEVAEKHDGYLRTYFKTHVRTVVGTMLRQEGRKKDGSRFPLELAIREIVKQGQNPLFIGYCRDASQDTALERAMQLSNLVTQLSPIPIVVINRQGIIQTFNNAASDTFDYSMEEALGQDVSLLMTTLDAQYHAKYLKTYAKTKLKSAIDNIKKRQARRKGGQQFVVEVSVKEIIPSSGDEKQICYLGFIRDMTAVQALQQAGLINDTIANISTVPLVVINIQGIVLKFSKSAEQIFGYDASDVLSKNVKMLMPSAVAEKHDEFLLKYKKRARSGESEHTIERVVHGRRRTGEEFPAELTVREVRKQGQEPMFVGYITDMSTRYEVLRRKLITESSINLSSAPIISITPQGLVKSFNEAAEDCFGYTKGEIVGQNVKVLMPRKTAEYHDQFLATYLKTGVKHVVDRNRDVTAKRKNGKRFAAALSVREIREGSDHFFVAYVQDRSGVAALEQASLVNDAIITMTTHAIIGIDESGVINRFSPAAEALFQYKAVEAIGRNVSMLMPEPHRANHNNYLERYAKTKVKKVLGTTMKNLKAARKDGTEFNIELSVGEVDIDGREVTYIAAISDITDRIASQAEHAVARASEEMSVRALLAIDEQGIVVRANRAACGLFGYEPQEVLSRNIKMLMPEDIAANHDKFLRNYKVTGIKHIIDSSRKVIGRTKTGTLFELEVHVKEVKLAEGTSLFLGYIDDVTRKKEMSIAQSLSETVMSLIPAPLIIITSKGIITHFNKAAEATFEFEASQVVGRNVSLLMPLEVGRRHDDFLKRYSETGEKHIIDSVRQVEGETKSGHHIPLRVSVREVKKAGNETLFVGFVHPM